MKLKIELRETYRTVTLCPENTAEKRLLEAFTTAGAATATVERERRAYGIRDADTAIESVTLAFADVDKCEDAGPHEP